MSFKKQIISKMEAIEIIKEEIESCTIEDLQNILEKSLCIDDYLVRED